MLKSLFSKHQFYLAVTAILFSSCGSEALNSLKPVKKINSDSEVSLELGPGGGGDTSDAIFKQASSLENWSTVMAVEDLRLPNDGIKVESSIICELYTLTLSNSSNLEQVSTSASIAVYGRYLINGQVVGFQDLSFCAVSAS